MRHRILETFGSRESIHQDVRLCVLIAPSLCYHPMPPRITEESNRPRVSDRTMVANLATTTLVRLKKMKGGITIMSMKPLGTGIGCLAYWCETTYDDQHYGTVAHRAGGWMHESIRSRPAGGEKCLLTSPFTGPFLVMPRAACGAATCSVANQLR